MELPPPTDFDLPPVETSMEDTQLCAVDFKQCFVSDIFHVAGKVWFVVLYDILAHKEYLGHLLHGTIVRADPMDSESFKNKDLLSHTAPGRLD
jgi:hypothetical protein